MINKLSNDVGESRIWAGLHFRSDITAGSKIGQQVAGKAIERAKTDGSK